MFSAFKFIDCFFVFFFFQAEDGIRDAQESRGLGDVYKRQAGEILGFLPVFHYDDRMAQEVVSRFDTLLESENSLLDQDPEYSPVMLTLGRQAGMAEMLVYAEAISGMLIFLFVLAMSIELWNAGLLGGLRRYTEFGVRIALGEDKGHIYRSLLWEALMIGSIGSVVGTFVGVALVYIFHNIGFNFSALLQNCLLYTSDAADDLLCVDLGGRRIIKKKTQSIRVRKL